MMSKAISKINSGKAAGSAGITIEMIKVAGDGFTVCLTSLFNHIIYIARVPNDWHLSYIISLFIGKGDPLSCGNYRGLKLQEHVMQILEHIRNTIIQG